VQRPRPELGGVAFEARSRAAATTGANWLRPPRRISSSASSRGTAAAYGRSVVIAFQAFYMPGRLYLARKIAMSSLRARS
jgi:hypothetical protein